MQYHPPHLKPARRRALTLAGAFALALLLAFAAGCGDDEPSAKPSAQPSAASPAATSEPSQDPVSSEPPLVDLGEAARYETPEGGVIRVVADQYADPGTAAGAVADPGERLVTLRLTVTAEGAQGGDPVKLPFAKVESFLLIGADDTISVAQLCAGDDLLGASLAPRDKTSATLAFSVSAAQAVRFVCTPIEGTTPRSATWQLGQ
jgi:hypothetical protein